MTTPDLQSSPPSPTLLSLQHHLPEGYIPSSNIHNKSSVQSSATSSLVPSPVLSSIPAPPPPPSPQQHLQTEPENLSVLSKVKIFAEREAINHERQGILNKQASSTGSKPPLTPSKMRPPKQDSFQFKPPIPPRKDLEQGTTSGDTTPGKQPRPQQVSTEYPNSTTRLSANFGSLVSMYDHSSSNSSEISSDDSRSLPQTPRQRSGNLLPLIEKLNTLYEGGGGIQKSNPATPNLASASKKDKDGSEVVSKPPPISISQPADQSQTPPTTTGSSTPRNESNIMSIINELISTEGDYLRDLDFIIREVDSLMQKKTKYARTPLAALFSIIQIIRGLNATLGSDLTSNGTPTIETTTKVFKNIHAFLKMYSQYCINYTKAIVNIKELAKSDHNFNQFLTEVSSNPLSRGLGLQDYLIKPIQRICKYPLFFKELIKNSPGENAELEEIYSKLNEVADYVNECLRTSGNTERLLMIKDEVDNVPFQVIESSRRIILDLPCRINKTYDHNDTRHLYIFNDIVMVARPRKLFGGNQFSISFPFHLTSIVSNGDATSILISASDNNYPSVTMEVIFSSLTQKLDVYNQLNQLMYDYRVKHQTLKRGLDSESMRLWIDEDDPSVQVFNNSNGNNNNGGVNGGNAGVGNGGDEFMNRIPKSGIVSIMYSLDNLSFAPRGKITTPGLIKAKYAS
ncbi:hypothetical protein SAMD00019534_102040 [Acytostelium subglobosum LB1]|uniref:hypothetical protein n=1 Tax=Acytostelium subglobosum LB1 TaxID=1410327 RepID=UPI000644CE8F|nr:hypothetical protein SAMD00019534_102040 [Acytostelium subglobosum LB1]GAM27029.1 hypothetical protein SAMD00019534_102040 [Acytostelium subglobosum LB1]|eukprot:XP_012749909.1 hypothetical protein SAMD00019534_102040 [Acytostelium subglobosum LB1]